ncbi:hypothetical protein J3R83DRAFT_5180 [Lanmaoa asiatica]|nr:hypothetical protein J3R83DRAFT_5180 [Lanmaoa asiatica]
MATRDLDEDQEMVTPQIVGLFVDCSDPQKAIEVQGQTIDDEVHIDLAEDILKTLFNDDIYSASPHVLFLVLFGANDHCDVEDEKSLVYNVFMRRPIRDISAWNAFHKFDTAISRKYADKLSNFSEEEYRQLETFFEFLNDIIPLGDGEEIEIPMTSRERTRYVLRVTISGGAGRHFEKRADGDVGIGNRSV